MMALWSDEDRRGWGHFRVVDYPRSDQIGSNKKRALLECASLFSELLYVDQVLNSVLYIVTNSPYLFYW